MRKNGFNRSVRTVFSGGRGNYLNIKTISIINQHTTLLWVVLKKCGELFSPKIEMLQIGGKNSIFGGKTKFSRISQCTCIITRLHDYCNINNEIFFYSSRLEFSNTSFSNKYRFLFKMITVLCFIIDFLSNFMWKQFFISCEGDLKEAILIKL